MLIPSPASKATCRPGRGRRRRVTSAESSGEIVPRLRGILKGREPIDAQYITQRICGVCPVEHGDRLRARAGHGLRRDAPDQRSARRAISSPPPTSSNRTSCISTRSRRSTSSTSRRYCSTGAGSGDELSQGLGAVGNRLRQLLSRRAVLAAHATAAHATDPHSISGAIRNYLEAWRCARRRRSSAPCSVASCPHVASIIPGGATIRLIGGRIDRRLPRHHPPAARLHRRCYVPDVLAVAGAFPDYYQIRARPGQFPRLRGVPRKRGGTNSCCPPACWSAATWKALDQAKITEDVGSSWFSSASEPAPACRRDHPGSEKAGAYSWIKAPRYDGA